AQRARPFAPEQLPRARSVESHFVAGEPLGMPAEAAVLRERELAGDRGSERRPLPAPDLERVRLRRIDPERRARLRPRLFDLRARRRSACAADERDEQRDVERHVDRPAVATIGASVMVQRYFSRPDELPARLAAAALASRWRRISRWNSSSFAR